MGLVREVAVELGGVSICIGKVLPCAGKSISAIWGRDLGAVGFNVEKIEVIHVGFLWQVTGKKVIRKEDRYS